MKILPFKSKHIQQATKLAELNYKEENKRLNNILPKEDIPDLSEFVDNNLGVVAFDGDNMLGYIGCYGPCHHHFGKVDGIWSPVHANGSIKNDAQKNIFSDVSIHIKYMGTKRYVVSCNNSGTVEYCIHTTML